jgi:SBP domain
LFWLLECWKFREVTMGRLAHMQVEGCTRRLAREKEYYQRYRVCKFHSAQTVVTLGGEPHRFCQQCCMFQHLTAFDGERR